MVALLLSSSFLLSPLDCSLHLIMLLLLPWSLPQNSFLDFKAFILVRSDSHWLISIQISRIFLLKISSSSLSLSYFSQTMPICWPNSTNFSCRIKFLPPESLFCYLMKSKRKNGYLRRRNFNISISVFISSMPILLISTLSFRSEWVFRAGDRYEPLIDLFQTI